MYHHVKMLVSKFRLFRIKEDFICILDQFIGFPNTGVGQVLCYLEIDLPYKLSFNQK